MQPSLITRSLLALAAIGAAVIHFALVAGSSPALAALMLVVGIAESAWAITILITGRLVAPRLAQGAAIMPVIVWSLAVVVATLANSSAVSASIRFVPMAIAVVFELFVATLLGLHFRRASNPPRIVKAAGAARYLSAIIVGGFVVGALITPALAATQAGAVAADHGGMMGMMMPDSHH
jgi:hypothetical protein